MTPLRRTAVALLVLPVLSLAACGGSSSDSGSGAGGAGAGGTVIAQGAPGAQTATIVATPKLQFTPNEVTAKVGTLRLTMEVDGGVPHNLVFGDASLGKDVPTTSSAATGTFVFPQAGTYAFSCTIHPGMDGKVVVS